jgi:hypothetical protein
MVELIDRTILSVLPQAAAGELHSETPGMILDRLSILAIRMYHTLRAIEMAEGERALRLTVLDDQRVDLELALHRLMSDISAGSASFRVYRQFKASDPAEGVAAWASIEALGTVCRWG